MNGFVCFLSIIVVLIGIFQLGLHRIEEGYVGIYWRGGALLSRMTGPGMHLKIPLLDSHAQVQVTLQTDSVRNIPCGTSGGVLIHFDTVEVVNRLHQNSVIETVRNYTVNYDKVLIFDKLHHELNQFCSRHTLQEIYIEKFSTVDDMLLAAIQESANTWCPGLEIVAVRITKPVLPRTILENYEKMEAEKTKLMIATQLQKTVEKEAETMKKQAIIEAQKHREVKSIKLQQEIEEKEAEKKMAAIQDEQHIARSKALADARTYQLREEANANKLLLTKEYIQLEMVRAVANNTKIFFGQGGGGLESLFTNFLQKLDK